MLLVAIIINQLVFVVQQMGVLSTIKLTWAEPFASLLEAASVVTFDVEILNLECALRRTTPTMNYSISLLIVVVMLAGVCLLHTLQDLAKLRNPCRTNPSALIRVLGTIYMMFLTSMVNGCIAPFQCQDHPNGKDTLRRYPTVICFSDAHTVMIALGCAFLLVVPFPFLVASVVVVHSFPKALRTGDLQFFGKYSFMFQRFTTDRYWFVLFFVFRNLILALTPIMPTLMLQVVILQMVMLSSLMISALTFPWRVPNATYFDMAVSVTVSMLLTSTGFFAVDQDTTQVANFCLVMVVLIIVGLSGGLFYGFFATWSNKKKKTWKYFLCHHKGGAGAFARLLKMQLLETIDPAKKVRVWIDCDDLTNLEMLFDYVGSQSDNVAILMSKELFMRPWCMGELVTSHLRHVTMLPLIFADFVALTDEFVDNYGIHVDITCLVPHGITLEMVQTMLGFVRTLPAAILPAELNTLVIRELAVVLEANDLGKATLGAGVDDPREDATVVVIADHSNSESVATALVLIKCLRMEARDNPTSAPCFLRKDATVCPAVKICIFVLSNGAFSQPYYIKVMISIAERKSQFIPIIAEDGFRFPDKTMLQNIEKDAPTALGPYGICMDPKTIVELINNLFMEIAVVFSPQDYSSNESLLKTKAHDIADRVNNDKLQKLGAKITTLKDQVHDNDQAHKIPETQV